LLVATACKEHRPAATGPVWTAQGPKITYVVLKRQAGPGWGLRCRFTPRARFWLRSGRPLGYRWNDLANSERIQPKGPAAQFSAGEGFVLGEWVLLIPSSGLCMGPFDVCLEVLTTDAVVAPGADLGRSELAAAEQGVALGHGDIELLRCGRTQTALRGASYIPFPSTWYPVRVTSQSGCSTPAASKTWMSDFSCF